MAVFFPGGALVSYVTTTRLEISTDGDVIVISPVRPARRTERLRKVMGRARDRYAGTFKRLAE